MKTYTIERKTDAIFRVEVVDYAPTQVIENIIKHYIDEHSKETYGICAYCNVVLSSGKVFINSDLYFVDYSVVEVVEDDTWEVRVKEFSIK